MILPHNDIIEAEKQGLIAIENKKEIGATSIDIHIDKLYKLKKEKLIVPSQLSSMPYEEFKEKHLVEVHPKKGIWELSPNQSYQGESIENIFLSNDFTAELATRSSWGRYGVYITHTADEMNEIGTEFRGKIPFMMASYGTSVLLRPGDCPGQLCISYEHKFPLMDEDLKTLIERKGVMIKRDGKDLNSEELEFNQGITLTLDDQIQIYNGDFIDPKKPVDNFFEEHNISEEGFEIKKGQFFISSSREEVMLSPYLIGWVKASDYLNLNPSVGPIGPEGIVTTKTHPNAPKIDPCPIFQGKITFENQPFFDLRLKPGQRLTELNLYCLNSPYQSKNHTSRYKWQNKATSSKGHID